MNASPDRVLARVVLVALAIGGMVVLAALALLVFAAGPTVSGARLLRCLIAPISSLDAVVHASAVAVGALIGRMVLAGIRTVNRDRATVAELRGATEAARLGSPPPAVARAAMGAAVAGRVDVVAAPRPFAFAYGWVRPRICISTGLVERLAEQELAAVLHHEGWHVARRDPLRLLVVRTIGAAFAFVPPVRRLVRLYLVAVEIAADRHVVGAMGDPRSLAGALVKVAGAPVAAPAFEGHAEARIAALIGEPVATTGWRSRTAAAVLLLELVPLVVLLRGGTPVLAGVWTHPVC